MAMVLEFYRSGSAHLVVAVVQAVDAIAVLTINPVGVTLAVQLDAVASLAVAAFLRLHRAQLRRLQKSVLLLVAGIHGRA